MIRLARRGKKPTIWTFLAVLGLIGVIAAEVIALSQASTEPQAPPTTKPIVEKDGKTLLWASGSTRGEGTQWFDMTDSLIDPHTFQYGIGKDRIPSIDEPAFVAMDDARLARSRIDGDTLVVGYAAEGEAKAYPIHIMNRHEIVNDTFGDVHLTVAW